MADTRALKDRIISSAEKDAQEILEGAKREAHEIRERAKKKSQRECEEMMEKAMEENIRLLEREKTMAHLEQRKILLGIKQEELEKVFSSLTQQIKDMPDKEYKEILKKMLLSQVETGTEEVIFPKDDRKRLGDDFLKAINQTLRSKGKKGELKLSQETREFAGGFILKGHQVENNNSLTEILAIQRDQLETMVARILFEE